MAKNNLNVAKKNKFDDFFTTYEDIELELCHYKEHFKGKIVYCNCDNPKWSNFWKYFHQNFDKFKLKKLISTYYNDDGCLSCIMEYTGGNDQDVNCWIQKQLKCDGDFRSDECVEILKKADIIVTNPPFSLLKNFFIQLIKYNKNFVILGNINAVTYKDVFPLLKNNKIRIGYSIHSGDRKFYVPNDYILDATNCGIDENGQKFIRVKGVRWFTNLDIKKHYINLDLSGNHYSSDKYPKYDNYEAIEVSKVADIPCDYYGIMATPITFLDKYNPEQFEIIGIDYDVKEGKLNELINPTWTGKLDRGYIQGKRKYARIFIRNKISDNYNK